MMTFRAQAQTSITTQHRRQTPPSHLTVSPTSPYETSGLRQQEQSYAFSPSCSDESFASAAIPSDNMLRTVAHDLVNLLFAIQGHTELASGHLPRHHSIQKHLDHVLMAGDKSQKLLEHVLRSANHGEQPFQPIQLEALIDEVLVTLSATLPPSITLKKIDHSHFGLILGHSIQIYRVILNLVSNAVQAMSAQDAGTVFIRLEQVEGESVHHFETTVHPYLKLTIQDTGPGISPERCQRIFDPYVTSHHQEKGRGLGLPIVKNIVTQHKGMVTVESQPARGTTFNVYFPCYQE